MTKLIAAAIIIVVLWGGWHLFLYWESVRDAEEIARKEAISSQIIPEHLPGMPQQLESSLKAAQRRGPAAMREWFKTYGRLIEDPRRAWIELDYCGMIFRENPAEARRVFAEVRNRTPPSSPVWPRIKALEQSYD
jgi:hypothetical protein